MKIYEYSVRNFGRGIQVKEVEVEEKAKTFKVIASRGWRLSIKKDDIGKILIPYDLIMYLTERDDERYIKAIIEHQEKKVAAAQATLVAEEIKLENYENLLKQEDAE